MCRKKSYEKINTNVFADVFYKPQIKYKIKAFFLCLKVIWSLKHFLCSFEVEYNNTTSIKQYCLSTLL